MPLAVTAVVVLVMGALAALLLWAFLSERDGAPPLPVVVVLIALPLAVIAGVVLALVQRLREIGKGEEDEARKY